jgi:CHAT domain-containing protein
MRGAAGECLVAFALVVCASVSAFARFDAVTDTPDEQALRQLVHRLFDAYRHEDLDGVTELWSHESPQLAPLRKSLQDFFATSDRIIARKLRNEDFRVEGNQATARLFVEVIGSSASTGDTARFGKTNRVVQFVRTGSDWKIWRETSPEEDFAVSLVAGGSEEERARLLAGVPEFLNALLARTLNSLGSQKRADGSYSEALEYFNLGLKIAERVGSSRDSIEALNGLGETHQLESNYTRANQFFEHSLNLSQKAGNKSDIGRALVYLADVKRLQGGYEQSIELAQRALALGEDVGDKAVMAQALNTMARVYFPRGDYESVLRSSQRALQLFENIADDAGMARSLLNIAGVHGTRSNFDLALGYSEKALVLSETSDRAVYANALNSIASHHSARGDYARALNYHQRSLRIREMLGDKAGIGQSLHNLGVVNRATGNYNLALAYFQKALAMKQRVGNEAVTASTLSSLGLTYYLQGNRPLALEYYLKALKQSDIYGDRRQISYTLANIGHLERDKGDYDSALEYFRKSLAQADQLGDRWGVVQRLNDIATVNNVLGDHVNAFEAASRGAEMARAISHRAALWKLLTTRGVALRAMRKPAQAKRAFEESIAVIEEMRALAGGGEQQQQAFFEDKVYPYHQMVALLLEQNDAAAAFAYAERAKARVLLDVLQNGRININKAITVLDQEQERKLNNQLLSLSSQIAGESSQSGPNQSRVNALKLKQDEVRLEREAFRTSLYARNPELKVRRGEAQPIGPEETRALLSDRQTALLEYVVTDERSYLLVITDGRAGGAPALKSYALNTKSKALADLVSRFRSALARHDLGFREPARQLYDLLLLPAREDLKGKKTVVIVPDGVLWDLPFQALQSGEGRYVVEEYAISYAPSLTVLRETIRTQDKKIEGAKGPRMLLAFANPGVESRSAARAESVAANVELSRLPEAERQAKSLQELYGRDESTIYTGAEAREERAKAEAPGFRILVFATHAVLNDANPMYSHIVLSQAKSSSEDGLLEAWELMNLDLQAQLVILSACETARGRVGAGEGVIGLTWALFVAGSPATVVSQWKVESASTTELMLEFHRHLRSKLNDPKSTVTTADALREAQLKLLRTAAYRHPFHWAGFILVGDGR